MSAIDLFAQFATDEKVEEEGVLTPIPGCGDTKFRIARDGNKSYNKLLQKLVKQNRPVLDSKGPMAEAKNEEIYIEVLAKTILLGWEGKVLVNKVLMDYSYATAVKLLSIKGFRAAVIELSESVDNYKVVKEEEEAKN